jgi:hypothetical protein
VSLHQPCKPVGLLERCPCLELTDDELVTLPGVLRGPKFAENYERRSHRDPASNLHARIATKGRNHGSSHSAGFGSFG